MKLHPLTLQFSGELEQAFLNYYYNKSLRQGRIGILTGIFLYFIFGVLDYFTVSPELKANLWFVRYVIICPLLITIFLLSFSNYFKRFLQIFWSISILLAALGLILIMMIIAFSTNQTLDTNTHVSIIIIMMYAYAFIVLRFVYSVAVILTIIALYNLVALFVIGASPVTLLNPNFFMLSANFIGMFASYNIEMYMRKSFFHNYQLEIERNKADKLLLNVLPQPIASRLKQKTSTIAESFTDVSILFADIVDFTHLSTKISPIEIVNLLNQIFSEFDELAAQHGLEKIKTIGDAYMVAGGLPNPRIDHAEAIAEMGLDMQSKIAHFRTRQGEPFMLRIGINSGPVVAGVIGLRKFIYDLWGDTVNTASRMESQGIPGSIQVTEETYQLLSGKFIFEERGIIDVKGKGQMKTYLLTGRKS
ncbi:MAG: adenylate/guanylate cyclase domain-containing protein [Symploca sp. SIO2C1]|nr:adenylate/guanylate cyclase domain-containing protein [Symploca sp. SIO2C1]